MGRLKLSSVGIIIFLTTFSFLSGAQQKPKGLKIDYSFSEDGRVNVATNVTSKNMRFMVEVKAENISSLAEECRGVVERAGAVVGLGGEFETVGELEFLV